MAMNTNNKALIIVFLQRPVTSSLLNLSTFLSTLTRNIHRQQ